MSKAEIRDAATIIVLRDAKTDPKLLMGQRGKNAVFMPNKYVFPGGAVAAIRELWEETGLICGDKAAPPPDPVPADWQAFIDSGHRPSAAGLRYIFRAITPPGRPRRFDAHFFLTDATHIAGDLDDFSGASDELSHLHWVRLSETRELDMPFITEVVDDFHRFWKQFHILASFCR